VTMENIADTVTNDGLATRDEVDELLAELDGCASNGRTFARVTRIIQVWGKRIPKNSKCGGKHINVRLWKLCSCGYIRFTVFMDPESAFIATTDNVSFRLVRSTLLTYLRRASVICWKMAF